MPPASAPAGRTPCLAAVLTAPAASVTATAEPSATEWKPAAARTNEVRVGAYVVRVNPLVPRAAPPVGAYSLTLDRITTHGPAPAPEGGAAVPPSVTLGLRVLPTTREDALRFAGLSPLLTVTDSLGRRHPVAAASNSRRSCPRRSTCQANVTPNRNNTTNSSQ